MKGCLARLGIRNFKSTLRTGIGTSCDVVHAGGEAHATKYACRAARPVTNNRQEVAKPRRSWSGSPMVCGRASNPGASFCARLKRRGLSSGPQLAVRDGALGFWEALDEVWPNARGIRPESFR